MTSHFLSLSLLFYLFVCAVQGRSGQNDTNIVTSADGNCTDPNGHPGNCIGVHFCEHIVKIINQKPIPPNLIEFIRKSRCHGPGSYSVCCPFTETNPKSTALNKYDSYPGCKSTASLPARDSQCCGLEVSPARRFIVAGGNDTAIDQYPWLALIEYRGRDDMIKLLCGAVLISGKYVLTAAHCVTTTAHIGTPVNIRLGEYDTSKDGKDCTPAVGGGDDCTEGLTVIPIEKIIVHPEYDPESTMKRHDIVLIRMAALAPSTDFIRPICLPAADFTTIPRPPPDTNYKFFVAGWGAIDELGKELSKVRLDLEVPYKNIEECQPLYSVARRKVILWKGQICAGGEAGKDFCRGDRGGPLMLKNGETFEVVGIESFGTFNCGTGVPGIYTKVYEYDTWIRSEIKD